MLVFMYADDLGCKRSLKVGMLERIVVPKVIHRSEPGVLNALEGRRVELTDMKYLRKVSVVRLMQGIIREIRRE